MNGYKTLSAAESERLALLIEECGEVIQAATKVLRHGYESFHPEDPTTSNRDLLTNELADLFAVYEMMDADFARIDASAQESAFAKKMRYCHHQL